MDNNASHDLATEPDDDLAKKEAVKLTLYIAAAYPRKRLTDYSEIKLRFDAEMVSKSIKDSDFTASYSPLRNRKTATTDYDDQDHGVQFRISLFSPQWRDDANCQRQDPGHPICKYHGDYLFMTMKTFNQGKNWPLEGDASEPYKKDWGSNQWGYRVDLRDFFSPDPANNPYAQVGQRHRIEKDILPMVKQAILTARDMVDAETGEPYLPPRLPKAGGGYETDAQYLSHYWVSSSNVGFEVSGLSDLTMNIYEFSMVGVPK